MQSKQNEVGWGAQEDSKIDMVICLHGGSISGQNHGRKVLAFFFMVAYLNRYLIEKYIRLGPTLPDLILASIRVGGCADFQK